jgi:hypothetical protein
MRVKLIDRNIRHIHNYGGYDVSEHMEWYRGVDRCKIGVFTDHMLPYVGKLSTEYSCDIRIAWIMEPPCINKRHWEFMNEVSNRGEFDHILTYSMEHVEKWKNAVWYPGGGSMMYKKEWQIYDKTKNIMMVASDKNSAPGHQLRHTIAVYPGLEVIGKGYKPFPEHERAKYYKDYRFQIYVQNMVMEDMWGDRLIDCFLTGTVPIVWGGHFLHKYFNKHGYLTFNTIEDLCTHLDVINESGEVMYKHMMPYIRDNFKRAKKFGIVEDYLYKHLFSKL